MFPLTPEVKKWLAEKHGVKADATDEEFRRKLFALMADGTLTPAEWGRLEKGQVPDARAVISDVVKATVGEELKAWGERFEKAIADVKASVGGTQGGNGAAPPTVAPAVAAPTTDLERSIDARMKAHLSMLGVDLPGDASRVNPAKLMSRAAQDAWLVSHVRVKGAWERFDNSRKDAYYPMATKSGTDHFLAGQRCTFPDAQGPGFGRPLSHPSKRDQAIIGAWFKWVVGPQLPPAELPPRLKMEQQDYELLNYALHEMPWTGIVGGEQRGLAIDGEKLSDLTVNGEMGVKALLDDAVSGGIFAAPVVVEDSIILQPLLYGELFPRVTVINLTRGRRITAPTMGVPTITSGIPEGTPIPLFDTTNFIGHLDTTVYTAVGAMEIGMDLEEDSPANLGATVVARYGEANLQWLDYVIALGDGVTQPKGLFNTSTVTTVASANGPAGPLTVSDGEALLFAVNKAFRVSRGGRNGYVGNEVVYRRFRSIPLGTQWANSRFAGTDYGSYTWLNFPFCVVPLVPNNELGFMNFAYYRMYRRVGFNVRVETGGKELTLKNVKLVVIRGRWGGQLEQGGSAGIITDSAA
jgi:hypothetical protein